MDERTYITVNEAARRASVDPKTVRRWYREGKLTKYVSGTGRVSIDEAELTAFIVPQPSPAVTGVGA